MFLAPSKNVTRPQDVKQDREQKAPLTKQSHHCHKLNQNRGLQQVPSSSPGHKGKRAQAAKDNSNGKEAGAKVPDGQESDFNLDRGSCVWEGLRVAHLPYLSSLTLPMFLKQMHIPPLKGSPPRLWPPSYHTSPAVQDQLLPIAPLTSKP